MRFPEGRNRAYVDSQRKFPMDTFLAGAWRIFVTFPTLTRANGSRRGNDCAVIDPHPC
jgi:hypothetical protein